MFRFKLAPVLRHRKWQEEEKMRELAEINARLSDADRARMRMQDERNRGVGEATRTKAEAKSVLELQLYDNYFKGMDDNLARNRLQSGEITQEMDNKRQELVNYVKRRRIIEILRDRQKERYDLQERRREQKELDEIGERLFYSENPMAGGVYGG